jgi:hypothetical protein
MIEWRADRDLSGRFSLKNKVAALARPWRRQGLVASKKRSIPDWGPELFGLRTTSTFEEEVKPVPKPLTELKL